MKKKKLEETITREMAPKTGTIGFDCSWPKLPDGLPDMTKTPPSCNDGLCCGKAKFPDADNDTIIEICNDEKALTYTYQPPAIYGAKKRPSP